MTASIVVDSPVGPLRVTADDDGTLTGVRFGGGAGAGRPPGPLAGAVEQLAAYFAGRLTEFDLRLRMEGTGFQRRVWEELRAIPYGETRTYGQIAAALGEAGAARAVGTANNRNPISIVVPCHRVVGSDGRLVGYGGGLDRKAWLLRHEGALVAVGQGRLF
ncbi:MAG: methylated-DNA--[protein]-cysteine S-methyltransferase [Acidimicrobiales bacterium]